MLRALLAALALAAPALAAPPVTAVAYRADGKLLAVGGRDTVTLLDPATGDPQRTLAGQDGRVTGLAFAPSSQLAVASGTPGKSGVLRVYSTADDATPVTLTAHKDAIYALAFSPDGNTLATAGYDRLIKLWAVPLTVASRPAATLTDHSDAVYALAYSPDGKLLASAGADRAVKLWDTATNKRLYTLPDATDWVYAVAWHPDGKTLYGAGVDRSLRSWAVTPAGGTLTASVFAHEAAVARVLVGAKGATVYTVGEDGAVKSWDGATLREGKAYPPSGDAIPAAALSPDGTQLALGLFDGTLRRVNAATGEVAKLKPPAVTAVAPDFARRGTSTAVTLTGTGLDRLASLSGDNGLTLELTPSPGDTSTRRTAKLTIPVTAPAGFAALRFNGADGPATTFKFAVDRFPLVSQPAATLTLPATVVGDLDRPGDADTFRFAAAAGYEFGAQLVTAVEPGKFAPVLTVTDAGGRVVAERDGTLLGVKLPAAGTYAVGVRDREFRGGAGVKYRLHLGPIPVITEVFPLGVTRGVPTPVGVRGVNLGALAASPLSVRTDAAVGSRLDLPVPRVGGDPVGPASVTVGEFPSASFSDSVMTPPAVPFTVDGELAAPGAVHVVAFRAKKGERLVAEVEASRLGSALDSFLEVLDAAGKPVPRATLRCTARAYTTFRDNTSNTPAIRLETWNEFAVNDYLFVKGELMRIAALPKGPDDDCQFVSVAGNRVGYLGTTPTQHANGSLIYKVEAHPPGTAFAPNGMPVFALNYQNDDGGPGYGKDSRVTFDPPADGLYRLRVRDANPAGGPNRAYRLTVRPPRPDFALKLTASSNVWSGGGIPATVTATRADDFDGPIRVAARGLPAGFSIPDTVIEAGQTVAVVTLGATAAAKSSAAAWQLVGTADIGGQPVTRPAPGGKLTVAGEADLTTTTASEVVLRPGGESRFTVKVERHFGFAGRVPLDVRGLPHGVRVMNIGLSGILVLPGESQREVVLYAEPWVTPQSRPVTVTARSERATGELRGKAPKDTEYAAPPLLLRVRETSAADTAAR